LTALALARQAAHVAAFFILDGLFQSITFLAANARCVTEHSDTLAGAVVI
jgi:hypothetical protein